MVQITYYALEKSYRANVAIAFIQLFHESGGDFGVFGAFISSHDTFTCYFGPVYMWNVEHFTTFKVFVIPVLNLF